VDRHWHWQTSEREKTTALRKAGETMGLGAPSAHGCRITHESSFLFHDRPCGRGHSCDQRALDGSQMMPKRGLARIRYEVVSLLLECGIAAAVLAALITSVPLVVILAAQLHGLATTGHWRGFQVAELLDVLRLDSSILPGSSQAIAEAVLALPASLILFTVALALCLLAGILHRLNRRERVRFAGAQQSALIKDIERELETRQ
jgi:cbb3-type cytochrome oxidase subunit 3